MKKIILFLILLPNIVLGETIYTDYEPYMLNTEIYLEETDTLKREEIKLFNTYIEEIEEKYFSLDNKISEDYIIDLNDCIYDYKYSLFNSEHAYAYQTKCMNENYQITKIELSEFSNPLELSEVKVQHQKESINYGFNIVNFKGFKTHLIDKMLYENATEIDTKSIISFIFFKQWDLKEIKIKLYFPKQNLEETKFKIKINNDIEYQPKILLPQENNEIIISFDNNYYNFLEENNFKINDKCLSYFSLKIPRYKHYKTNIIPLNRYIPLNNTDLFLLEDYKITYNYYKREKIEFVDDILLKDKEFDLKNYIKSSSIPIENLNVIHNINFEQDGIYKVFVYYQDKLISEKELKYNKENRTQIKKEINIEKNIRQNDKTTNKKIINTTVKKNPNVQKVTTKIVKNLNNQLITNVKENKYQKPIFIIVISIMLIILITFECTLIYVKKKYY